MKENGQTTRAVRDDRGMDTHNDQGMNAKDRENCERETPKHMKTGGDNNAGMQNPGRGETGKR